MQNVPIHLLNAFVVFNDSGNITEAAKRLQITQPALSKQLKQLEDALPSPVFTFSGRKKTLTAFGRNLYLQLTARIGDLQELVEQTWTLYADAGQARINIAARRGILDRMTTNVKFAGSIFFQELSNDEIIDSLLSFQSQIGIVHRLPDSSDLIAKPLFKENFQIVVPKNLLPHHQAFGKELFAKLKQLPCLGFKPDDEVLKSVCDFNSTEMRSLKMVRATESYASLVEMVEAKQGWAIIPNYLTASESKNWIISIPAKASPNRQFYLVYRSEFHSVLWFKDLIGEIRKCFDLRDGF